MVVVGSKSKFEQIHSMNSGEVSVVFLPADMSPPLGIRLAQAINFPIEKVNLEDYDYLLKVDVDVILPPKFLEENCRLNAAYIGRAGYAMLIKVKPSISVLNGRLAEVVAEDSFIGLKFLYKGFNIKNYTCRPILTKESKKEPFL